MMHACTFQALPHALMCLVVDHLCRHYHSSHIQQPPSKRAILLHLSHTCHSWRAVALYISYSRLYFDALADAPRVPSAGGEDFLPPADYAQTYLPYVQKVTISGLDRKTLPSASSWLTNIYKNWRCANAKSVVVEIYLYTPIILNLLDYSVDAWQMAIALRQMLPQISNAKLDLVVPKYRGESTWSSWCRLAHEMFKNVENTELYIQMPCLPPQTSANLFSTQLANIHCFWERQVANTIQLLQANSASLRILTIALSHADKLDYLFFRNDGSPVTFPHLFKLSLTCLDDRKLIPVAPIGKNVVPFPTLKHLQVMAKYPFSDDLLFRGNYKALVSLGLVITDSSIAMLSQYGMFSALTTRKLEVLTLVGLVNYDSELESSKPVLLRLLVSSQSLKRLTVDDFGLAELTVSILSENITMSNITTLIIKSARLTMLSTITLLQQVCTLQTLISQVAGIGADIEFADIVDLLAQVRTRYSLARSQLCSWKVYNKVLSISHTIACILCLADGCKFLSQVVFSQLNCEDAVDLLAKLHNSRLYSECKKNFQINSPPDLALYWQINRLGQQ